jgi:hypothetical protein
MNDSPFLSSLGQHYNKLDQCQCFSKLWTPQGRGSIYNTRIIDWLDENESFEIYGNTLRAWSQLEEEYLSQNRRSWTKFAYPKFAPTVEDQKKIMGRYQSSLGASLGEWNETSRIAVIDTDTGTRWG